MTENKYIMTFGIILLIVLFSFLVYKIIKSNEAIKEAEEERQNLNNVITNRDATIKQLMRKGGNKYTKSDQETDYITNKPPLEAFTNKATEQKIVQPLCTKETDIKTSECIVHDKKANLINGALNQVVNNMLKEKVKSSENKSPIINLSEHLSIDSKQLETETESIDNIISDVMRNANITETVHITETSEYIHKTDESDVIEIIEDESECIEDILDVEEDDNSDIEYEEVIEGDNEDDVEEEEEEEEEEDDVEEEEEEEDDVEEEEEEEDDDVEEEEDDDVEEEEDDDDDVEEEEDDDDDVEEDDDDVEEEDNDDDDVEEEDNDDVEEDNNEDENTQESEETQNKEKIEQYNTLKSLHIADLKTMAKTLHIKLSQNGKQLNKEQLIEKILNA